MEDNKLEKKMRINVSSKDTIYLMGGIAGILAGIVFRKNWTAEFSTIFRNIPGLEFIPAETPSTVEAWFELIMDLPFIALVYLDFFDLINYLLVLMLYFALFIQFRKHQKVLSILGILCGVASVGLHLILNPALKLFRLQNIYAEVSSEDIKTELINRGGQILVHYQQNHIPSIGLAISMLLFALAGLFFSIIIYENSFIPVGISICGFIAHGFLILHIGLLPVIPNWSFLFIPAASVFLMIWYIITGIRLVKYQISATETIEIELT